MRLIQLRAQRYRSLRDLKINFGNVNLLIGANASGKSNILDALRFLSEGLRAKEFSRSLLNRGGTLHLAWKGETAGPISLELMVEDQKETAPGQWRWLVELEHDQVKSEEVWNDTTGKNALLIKSGAGTARSGHSSRSLQLDSPTGCGLAAAMTDPDFPARELGTFVANWAFFDLEPQTLRRVSYGGGDDDSQLDAFGRNLAQRLYNLRAKAPERFEHVVQATRSILGLPESIEPRHSGDEGRYYFVQNEPGLNFPVNQAAVSSGTLRVLAFMTALFGESSGLMGIEEPENYIHPGALGELVNVIQQASADVQIIVTTHSPQLLNAVADPATIRIILRDPDAGTCAEVHPDPAAISAALDVSGFGLGEYLETRGFGT